MLEENILYFCRCNLIALVLNHIFGTVCDVEVTVDVFKSDISYSRVHWN
jgi:hypothetical protein